jgi:hypothetical protein
MDMTEKLKGLMEKVEPWQWAGGIAVAILGIYAYFKNKNKQTTSTDSGEYMEVPQATGSNVGSNTATYGDIQNLTEAVDNILGSQNTKIEEVSGKLVTYQDTLQASIDAQNKKIADTQTAIQNQADNFNNSFNQAVSSFNSAVANTNKVVEETSRSFSTQLQQVSSGGGSSSSGSSNSSGSSGGGSSVVQAVAKTVKETTDSIGQVIRTVTSGNTSTTYNLGNNGVGYDAAKSAAFESSLKTNTSAYNTEMARVNQVISDRKAQGLDTTAQEAYKAKIQQ